MKKITLLFVLGILLTFGLAGAVTGMARAQSAAEGAPVLQLPLDCTLGTSCWVARYANRGGDAARADFACGIRAQEGHQGTDFVLSSLAQMAEGVDVLAAADGEVTRVRDGEPDHVLGAEAPDFDAGRECGNGLLIDHGDGWQSQYCHMAQGSLTVGPGDAVAAGEPLGRVGLSGKTQFPHLHFNLFKDGEAMDPYDGQPIAAPCGEETPGLWESEAVNAYEPFSLIGAVFGDGVPDMATIWGGSVARQELPAQAPALVLTAKLFGALRGDRWSFKILDPEGALFVENSVEIEKNNQFVFNYAGRKKPAGGFQPGLWRGEVTVTRTGPQGDALEQRLESEVLVVEE
ncbi:MAG: M23 family metallopeptidase [Pseudomonadota bacterium]